MAADAVAEIKARLDVIEVIGGYVKLNRAGREHTGLCPFHSERSPSFTVSGERQVWYCFGCQEGGDLISFVRKIEHLDFPQTLQVLADRAGVEIESGSADDSRAAARRRKAVLELNTRAQAFFEHVLWATPAGEPGRDLLRGRGVGEELARQFGIGFAPAGGADGDALVRFLTARGASGAGLADAGLAHPVRHGSGGRDRFRHRLMFPIRDAQGQTIAFGGRALSPDEKAKYLNSPETPVYHKSSALFGIDHAKAAIATAGSVLIVEGYFDVIASHAAGVRNVVASSGTALAAQQVSVLGRQASRILLCFDADRAGRMATSRAVDLIAEAGIAVHICVMPAGVKDPDELVRTDPVGFAEMVSSAPPAWQVLLDWALAGHGGEGVDARRNALPAAVEVLQRIPEASQRALYADQVGTRLRLQAESIIRDVEHARRTGGERAAARSRVVAPMPVERVPPTASDGEAAGPDIPAWEGYLGSVVLQQPGMAAALVSTHGLDLGMLRSPVVRRLIEVALLVPQGHGFPLHALAEPDRPAAARLLMEVIPELREGTDHAVVDLEIRRRVERLVHISLQERLAELNFELRRARDEERDEDLATLLRRKHELTTEMHRLTGR